MAAKVTMSSEMWFARRMALLGMDNVLRGKEYTSAMVRARSGARHGRLMAAVASAPVAAPTAAPCGQLATVMTSWSAFVAAQREPVLGFHAGADDGVAVSAEDVAQAAAASDASPAVLLGVLEMWLGLASGGIGTDGVRVTSLVADALVRQRSNEVAVDAWLSLCGAAGRHQSSGLTAADAYGAAAKWVLLSWSAGGLRSRDAVAFVQLANDMGQHDAVMVVGRGAQQAWLSATQDTTPSSRDCVRVATAAAGAALRFDDAQRWLTTTATAISRGDAHTGQESKGAEGESRQTPLQSAPRVAQDFARQWMRHTRAAAAAPAAFKAAYHTSAQLYAAASKAAPKRGGAREPSGSRGGGGGGRGPRPRYTHFLSLRLKQPDAWSRMQSLQNGILEREPRLTKACIPVEDMHLTMGLLAGGDAADVTKAAKILSDLQPAITGVFEAHGSPLVRLRGLGTFGRNVLFVNVERDAVFERLLQVQQLVVGAWNKAGLVCNRVDDFNPHVTVMKMSKLRRVRDAVKGIDPDVHAPFKNVQFGRVQVDHIELVDMRARHPESGYYMPLQRVTLGDPRDFTVDTVPPLRDAVAESSAPLAQRPRRRARMPRGSDGGAAAATAVAVAAASDDHGGKPPVRVNAVSAPKAAKAPAATAEASAVSGPAKKGGTATKNRDAETKVAAPAKKGDVAHKKASAAAPTKRGAKKKNTGGKKATGRPTAASLADQNATKGRRAEAAKQNADAMKTKATKKKGGTVKTKAAKSGSSKKDKAAAAPAKKKGSSKKDKAAAAPAKKGKQDKAAAAPAKKTKQDKAATPPAKKTKQAKAAAAPAKKNSKGSKKGKSATASASGATPAAANRRRSKKLAESKDNSAGAVIVSIKVSPSAPKRRRPPSNPATRRRNRQRRNMMVV